MEQQDMCAMDDAAFRVFANLHPHEAYDTWPERFWEHFQEKMPGLSRQQMETLLAKTRE